MDIKSLMIGDWVYNKHHNKNIQITPYDFFTHTHNEFGEQSLSPHSKPIFGMDLEPIPITPKILEKNGFRIIFEGELHKTYFQDIYDFAVEIKIDCIGFTKLSMSNGLDYMVVIECKHIHQFQHALKLCGINKEIEL